MLSMDPKLDDAWKPHNVLRDVSVYFILKAVQSASEILKRLANDYYLCMRSFVVWLSYISLVGERASVLLDWLHSECECCGLSMSYGRSPVEANSLEPMSQNCRFTMLNFLGWKVTEDKTLNPHQYFHRSDIFVLSLVRITDQTNIKCR